MRVHDFMVKDTPMCRSKQLRFQKDQQVSVGVMQRETKRRLNRTPYHSESVNNMSTIIFSFQ